MNTTVTVQQLAQLADLDPSYFSKHRAELPPSSPVHTGLDGRPQNAFTVDDLAALIVERTGHLSEAIVRLRVALSTGPLRIVEVNDEHVLVRDDEPLTDLAPAVRTALLEQIHADNAAASQRRTRRHPATEETQP